MRAHFFHAFVCLVFILAILLIGFSLCLIPIAPDWIYYLTQKLQNEPRFFFQIGKGLLILGACLLFLFYWLSRKTFYSVVLEPSLSYSLHNKMVSRVISDYLKKEESSHQIPFKLNIYGQNVELIADLSQISLTEHERILKNLETKLGHLIEKQVGLLNKMTVTILSHRA